MTTNATAVNLIDLVRSFRDDPRQIKAIQWFQASTGIERQTQFARQWRNSDDGSPIDFVQVFRFYANQPHQNAALNWLAQTSQPRTIGEFARRWREIPDLPQDLLLNVPWFPQTDNQIDPHRTCNTSACAMVARFLGANIAGDDAYFQIVRKYGDTTCHQAQTRALNEVGIRSTWHTNLDFDDLDRSIEAKKPVVIGILHRGSLHNPTGGHMVVVIGRTAKRDYICHDPYGSLLDPGGGYTGAVENGRGVVYPRHVLNRRWLVEGANSGWGRLFL